MTTPVERPEPTYAMDSSTHIHAHSPPAHAHPQRSSDDDGTYVGEEPSHDDDQRRPAPFPKLDTSAARPRAGSHLTVDTVHLGPPGSLKSPSQSREQASRLNDELAMLQVEREVSNAAAEGHERGQSTSRSMRRTRSRRDEPEDEFDVATNPLHERTALYKPPENPSTSVSRFFKKVHNSSWLVRYFTYITPLVLIILIPLLLGVFLFENASVGGVRMSWFCIWLMIIWLSLWAGRLIAKSLPWPIGLISSLFTNNSKKWRDMGKQLELPATLFFWFLAIEISFLPTMKHHHVNNNSATKNWESILNKILISLLVGMTLNFIEKIIIQLIAISFHLRTYADRIDLNKFQIGSLAKLYKYSKEKIAMEDSEFEQKEGMGSGARTPGQYIKEAQKNTKEAFNRFGDIAGKVAGDFTGREITGSGHPNQVVLTLLGSTSGSQVLARRLYRTFARPETETVHSDDLKNAFDNDDEADAAFSMFDKDMNGDISMEELEAVCVEIGRERKSITASLKDLDSVVSKLDDVFLFIVIVITVLVFISIISTSAAGVLTSAGSSVLALSWLFSATAQEFLQSVIFVFVKHPFDVGDRVTIYGNTGAAGLGDDYFVKEIALLYTEFKKMEGHVVQAPNSYLNTLFILNQRRSGALAEAVPVIIKFGTTLEQIDALRQRLLEFVTSEKREYGSNILTELRQVTEVHSLTLNVVFFYKSNWQNELLRLQRRNKFICCLMVSMQECGIEGPRMRFPGQKESFPLYTQHLPHQPTPGIGHNGTPDNPSGMLHQQAQDEPIVPPPDYPPGSAKENESVPGRQQSILRNGSRARGESMAAMGRRVDFSLGMKDVNFAEIPGDVFEDRETASQQRATVVRVTSPSRHSTDRRGSNDMASSTSIASRPSHQASRLQRVNTDRSQTRERSVHRNRFFGRNRSRGQDEEAAMADIPESMDGSNDSKEKLDPRSGLVSPRAVRSSAEEARSVQSSGALPPESIDAHFHAPARSQTDNLEMRRFH